MVLRDHDLGEDVIEIGPGTGQATRGLLATGAARQSRALAFSKTQGVITHSEVKRHSDSDGSSYSVDVKYVYTDGASQVGRWQRQMVYEGFTIDEARTLPKAA